MGVLNVTPDSFSEGTHLNVDNAIAAGVRMEQDGADIIDVGGESTRPDAVPVSLDEELSRVLPVVRELAQRVRVPISVDTYKAEVARAALDAGATLVNDISGLQYDPALAALVSERRTAIVLMHMRGRPQTMYAEARYDDVVADVVKDLRAAIARAQAAGIARDAVIVDPGIGFAKRPEHSYGVLARLAEIGPPLDRPLLVGPSRKSFMRQAVVDRPAPQRDWGTAAAVTAAVLAGAHIVRVHAVSEMVQVVKVAEEIRRAMLTTGES
jgi:dihydropteroate synthase